MTPPQKKIDRWLGLALLLMGTILLYRSGITWIRHADSIVPGDFAVYWRAAERLIAGANTYVPQDPSPYKYSPTFTTLFRYSFYLFPERVAAPLWLITSLLSYFAALWFFLKRLRLGKEAAGLAVVALYFSWHGFVEDLSYGQVDLFLAAILIALSTETAKGRSPWTRSFLWALAFVIKPHVLLVFAAAGLAFSWREYARTAAVTALAYLLPIFWLGPRGIGSAFAAWAACLREQQDATFLTGNINQSFAAVVTRLFFSIDFVYLLTLVGLCLFGLALLIATASRLLPLLKAGASTMEQRLALYGFGLGAYVVFSPMAWRWWIVFWCPLAILAHLTRRKLVWFLPWFFLAALTQGPVVKALGLAAGESISRVGVFFWASFWLFGLSFYDLLHKKGHPSRKSKATPDKTSRYPIKDCGTRQASRNFLVKK